MIDKDMVITVTSLVALYKIFQPVIFRIWDKKNSYESEQTEEIESLRKEIENIKQEIVLIKSEKVSWKELNKMLDKLDSRFNDLQKALSKIEGKLEGGNYGKKIND